MNNELDDMKNLWQNAAVPVLDAQQMEVLLAGRSKNAFVKLRRNLIFEAILGLLLFAALGFAAIYSPKESARMAAAQVFFVCLPILLFYAYGIRNLKKGLSFTGNLKDTLRASVGFWKEALRLYFWFGVLILPVIFIAARWWRFSMMEEGQIQFFTGGPVLIVFKMIAAWALVAAVLWGLIHLSYGRWVKQLEKCLNEIAA